MPAAPAGLHHVTAIATGPQVNADFYHTALGLRLVKTTVSFDDPGTYHVYYGNGSGQPGTLITFFPWPGADPRPPREDGPIPADPPGFAIDEPLMRLGRPLKLPPWLEPTRDQIEHARPALKVPGPGEETIMPSPPHAATT